MVSARLAVLAAVDAIQAAPDMTARRSAETWLDELIWREFYQCVIYHFPDVRQESFRPTYRTFPWQNDEIEFNAWCEGLTGYPIVDAAMRELSSTGWMNNRTRMIVASFLTKDLLVDWRWGERWFMQHLVDGDPAANSGGWQWCAGTGTDAAPYFRIFNPTAQGCRFDPQGSYIRRWVPELAHAPLIYLNEPWKMPLDVQQSCRFIPGKHYPMPIIDHTWARQRALSTVKMMKG
jgi:deoxyribodipyrimidine photo-lyase